jgi:chitinase
VRPEDAHNFTLLLAKLREKLDASDDHLLTIAAGAGADFANKTELATLMAYLDFANLMTYDIHGGWDKNTDFNAPLYSGQTLVQPQWSIDQAVNIWRDAGVKLDKIVVGIPFYGKKYRPVKITTGLYGTYGRRTTITYQDVAKTHLTNNAYIRYPNEITRVPYLFNGSIFVSYDDATSIGKNKWAISQPRG